MTNRICIIGNGVKLNSRKHQKCRHIYWRLQLVISSHVFAYAELLRLCFLISYDLHHKWPIWMLEGDEVIGRPIRNAGMMVLRHNCYGIYPPLILRPDHLRHWCNSLSVKVMTMGVLELLHKKTNLQEDRTPDGND